MELRMDNSSRAAITAALLDRDLRRDSDRRLRDLEIILVRAGLVEDLGVLSSRLRMFHSHRRSSRNSLSRCQSIRISGVLISGVLGRSLAPLGKTRDFGMTSGGG